MTTSYYRLKSPITHLKVEETPTHVRVSIFVNHAHAGVLTVRQEEKKDLYRLFELYEEDDQCPLRSWWGGADQGSIIQVNDPTLPDETVVFSEYGELLTVGQVKARHGAKRADGYPTELFGYK